MEIGFLSSVEFHTSLQKSVYQFIQLFDFFREKFLEETKIVVETVVSLQRYAKRYEVEWNVDDYVYYDITRNTRAVAFSEKRRRTSN